jgi:DNA-binding response OmpR family regulator
VTYDVLVIDDELSLARNIKDYLQIDGLETDICGDGESALRLFVERVHPVVVLDIQLPGMDGFAVLEQLRHIHSKVHVIMVSARANTETGVSALAAGASDFMHKPLVLRDLGRVVTQARAELIRHWPTAP